MESNFSEIQRITIPELVLFTPKKLTFRDSSALIDLTSCAETSEIFFVDGLLVEPPPLSRKSFILSLNESAAPSWVVKGWS